VDEPAGKPERVAYLPPRAARARKLILRTQLGLPWLIAALAFAALILVAGIVLLLRPDRPGAPWVQVGPAGAFRVGAVTQVAGPDGQVLVVDRRDAVVRALLAAPGPCPVVADGDGYARACQQQRWDADGAPVAGGGPPLRRLPAQVTGGVLFVDPGD
jgi:hypothetical protein